MENESRPSQRLGNSVTMELPSMIILIAILVFFLVVIFVLLLQLYAKWLWSHIEESTPLSPETRRRRHGFDFSSVQDSPISTLGKGLDPDILLSLPLLIFQSKNFKDGLECAVCLCELVEGEKVRILPDCYHGFHIDCIDMWFHSHLTCPLCRNPVTAATALNSAEDADSPNIPTNVLFWGNQAQVTSAGVCLEEGPSQITCPASSSSSGSYPDAEIVIEVQNEIQLSTLSTSSVRRSRNEEEKLLVSTRLRSLKRLLSRERRVSPSCNQTSTNVEMEQVG